MKCILCTGGTYVGKTSVLEYLETLGYTRFESIGGIHIEGLVKTLGIEKSRIWREEYFLDFQKMNIFGDWNLYNRVKKLEQTKDDFIFLDRGVFDRIASLKRENIPIPNSLEKLVRNVSYEKKVFFFEPIPEHNIREQTGRMLNKEKSLLWAKYIEDEYILRGYNICRVPYIETGTIEKNIEARAEFVLTNI